VAQSEVTFKFKHLETSGSFRGRTVTTVTVTVRSHGALAVPVTCDRPDCSRVPPQRPVAGVVKWAMTRTPLAMESLAGPAATLGNGPAGPGGGGGGGGGRRGRRLRPRPSLSHGSRLPRSTTLPLVEVQGHIT
jgi:hypothetical protein